MHSTVALGSSCMFVIDQIDAEGEGMRDGEVSSLKFLVYVYIPCSYKLAQWK